MHNIKTNSDKILEGLKDIRVNKYMQKATTCDVVLYRSFLT